MNYFASLKLLTYKIGHYFYDAPCGMLTRVVKADFLKAVREAVV